MPRFKKRNNPQHVIDQLSYQHVSQLGQDVPHVVHHHTVHYGICEETKDVFLTSLPPHVWHTLLQLSSKCLPFLLLINFWNITWRVRDTVGKRAGHIRGFISKWGCTSAAATSRPIQRIPLSKLATKLWSKLCFTLKELYVRNSCKLIIKWPWHIGRH